MLATGLWMMHLSWPITTGWIRAALGLWGVGIVALVSSVMVVHRQIRLFDTEGPAAASYRRTSRLGRALGAGTGMVVVAILYLMIFKPGA
jgi:uncharacterized membrane protein